LHWLPFLGCVGFVLILTCNDALKPVREVWPKLLGCAQCSGFWAGVATFFWFVARKEAPPVGLADSFEQTVVASFHGGASSCVSYVLFCFIKYVGNP
jgi:hypothetical protein